MHRLTTLLLAAALAVAAQTPVPVPFGECGFDGAIHGAGAEKVGILDPNEFAIPRGDLCEQYTYPGWEETMQLHLGEGSDDYRDLIEQAVKVWNAAAFVPTWEPLIEISDERPSNYQLSSSFWENLESVSSQNLSDSQNVIYFKPDNSDGGPRGYSRVEITTFGNRMVEADVYINTDHVEEYGPNLVLTKLLLEYIPDDESGQTGAGAYAMVNATYVVILHEIGHALGLKHIPVTGNVMSREFMPGIEEQWTAPLALYWSNRQKHEALYAAVEHYPSELFFRWYYTTSPYMFFSEGWDSKTADLFTKTARLGAQEKMLLACIYQF